MLSPGFAEVSVDHMVGCYVLDRRVEFRGGETFGTSDEPIGRIELGRTSVGAEAAAVYRLVLPEDGNDG
jgi:hypothetical protein